MKRMNQIDKCRDIYLKEDEWRGEMGKRDGKRNKIQRLLVVWIVQFNLYNTGGP